MFIKIWKKVKTLKVVSTTINRGFGEVTRRKGRDSIAVKWTR